MEETMTNITRAQLEDLGFREGPDGQWHCADEMPKKRKPGTLTFELPIRVVSEANQREHWTKRKRRKDAQQSTVGQFTPQWSDDIPAGPWSITITKLGGQKMDSDNREGSMKHVRDALAKWLGIDDDGDEWERVKHEKRSKLDGGHGVRVEIKTRSPRG